MCYDFLSGNALQTEMLPKTESRWANGNKH